MCLRCKRFQKLAYSSVGKLTASGMGGFLNPPTHPEHSWSIKSLHGSSFGLSLTSAIEANWLDYESRRKAQGLLSKWERPAIESPEIQAWIKEVLAYFRHCYGVDPNSSWTLLPVLKWNASDLVVDSKANELENADIHAGVHFVRKYYPEYVPVAGDFAGTWGQSA